LLTVYDGDWWRPQWSVWLAERGPRIHRRHPAQIEAAQAGFGQMLQVYYPGTNPFSKQKHHVFILKNSVKDEELAAIPDLPFAFTLNLGQGIAGNNALKNLQHLKKLTGLDIGGTHINHEGLKDINLLPALDTLAIDRFQTTPETIKVLNEAGRLHILANMRAAGGARPKGAEDVVEIDLLGKFEINDECLQEFAIFKNVETMRLGGTGITDAGLKQLVEFKKLTTLDFITMPEGVTPAGIKSLQSVMPKLKVTRK
jgi:hypothetical protein